MALDRKGRVVSMTWRAKSSPREALARNMAPVQASYAGVSRKDVIAAKKGTTQASKRGRPPRSGTAVRAKVGSKYGLAAYHFCEHVLHPTCATVQALKEV